MRRIIPDVISQPQAICLGVQSTVREASEIMRENNIGAMPIVDNGVLKGIITVNDMTYRVIAEDRDPVSTLVTDVMTPDPDTVSADTTAIEALRLMQDGGYRHLPVVDSDRLLCVVSRRDFYGLEKARLDHETSLWERIG